MKRATWIPVLIVSTFLAALSYLFHKTSFHDPVHQERVLATINRMEQLETSLERDLLLVRGGMLTNYDRLNEWVAKLYQELEQLHAVPWGNKHGTEAHLQGYLLAVADHVRNDEEWIEQFKSGNALFRNSHIFLKQATLALARQISREGGNSHLAQNLVELSVLVSQLNWDSSPDALRQFERQLKRLREATAPAAYQDKIQRQLQHGAVILQYYNQVEEAFRELSTPTIPNMMGVIRSAFLDNYQQDEVEARGYRQLLYGCSLALLAYLCLLYFNLRRKADALEASNAQLAVSISRREKLDRFRSGQKRVLEKALDGTALPEVLGIVCETIEGQIAGAMCSVLLAGADGKALGSGVAPSLPESYAGALDGLIIGEQAGSCGTAACRKERVVVADIATDPLWTDFRDLALQHGILACWSEPLLSGDGIVLGTVAVSFHEVRAPEDHELEVLATGVSLAKLAVERWQSQHALWEAKEMAEISLHSIADALITTDSEGLVHFMNPVAEQLTGLSLAQARACSLESVFSIVNEDTRQPVENGAAYCLATGRVTPDRTVRLLLGHDGNEYFVESSASPIRKPDGSVVGAVLVFHDVSESRRLYEELSYQAAHDALTGLVNRREFERLLESLTSRASDQSEHALCYLDLDQFKIVNDTCGHVAGDELLRQLGGLLRAEIRSSDVLGRLGGDEFGLLLVNCPLAKAKELAESMARSIRSFRFNWQGRLFDVGVSIGLVPLRPGDQDPGHMMSQADVACYVAKDLGRNRIHVYEPQDLESTRRHTELHWAAEITAALEEGRLRLHRQGIFPLDEEEPAKPHFEMLVRMVDTNGGLVPPGSFIPAAERYNLMGAIDRWVIENSLRWFATAGSDSNAEQISINISGNSLTDEALPGFIRAHIVASGVPPEKVCFEITETAAIANLGQAIGFIQDLRAMGCMFSLDDFGSGLSSFAYLKNIPVDFLKIDGCFVRGMVTDPIDYAMVEAINQVGHVLGIRTIAEFVENQEIIEKLRTLGVDYAQGYALGRPEPVELLESRARSSKTA